MIGDILSWLGIGGSLTFIVGLAASFGLLSTFLPGIVVNALAAFAETVLRAVTWCARTFFEGLEGICQHWTRVFTLLACILIAGWVGDKYDPWRNLVDKPKPQASAPPSKLTPRQGTAQRQSHPVQNTFDYICKSMGGC